MQKLQKILQKIHKEPTDLINAEYIRYNSTTKIYKNPGITWDSQTNTIYLTIDGQCRGFRPDNFSDETVAFDRVYQKSKTIQMSLQSVWIVSELLPTLQEVRLLKIALMLLIVMYAGEETGIIVSICEGRDLNTNIFTS